MAINPALISNPVFQAIQQPDSLGMSGKSTILYANKYSGVSPVEMENELLDTFRVTNLNLTGLNLREQLSQLLQGYDHKNGPWYIDGINNVIHIHNRRIAMPRFAYAYQQENGEVLSFQVKTNWVRGEVKATLASQLGKNKETDIIHTEIPLEELKAPTEPKYSVHGGFNDYYYKDPDVEPLKMYKTNVLNGKPMDGSWGGIIERDKTFFGNDIASDNTRPKEHLELSIKAPEEATDAAKWESSKESYARGLVPQPDIERQVAEMKNQEILKELVTTESSELDSLIEQAKVSIAKSNSNPDIHREFEKCLSIWREHPDDPLEYMTEAQRVLWNRSINLGDHLGKYGSFLNSHSFSHSSSVTLNHGPGSYDRGTNDLVKRAYYYNEGGTVIDIDFSSIRHKDDAYKTILNQLDKYGYSAQNQNLAKELALEYAKAWDTSVNGGRTPTIEKGSITIQQNSGGNLDITFSIDDAVGNYGMDVTFGQFFDLVKRRDDPKEGGSVKARKQRVLNTIRNQMNAAKHKEIEIFLRVVGRPMLEANQYIHISNVGQKYSGVWYIKTCIHQLDSSGYTSSLTLVKNANYTNATNVSVNRDAKGNITATKEHKVVGDGYELLISSIDHAALLEAQRLDQAQHTTRNTREVLGNILAAQKEGNYDPNVGLYKAEGFNESVPADPLDNNVVYYEVNKEHQETVEKAQAARIESGSAAASTLKDFFGSDPLEVPTQVSAEGVTATIIKKP